jgi:hypothetical protein
MALSTSQEIAPSYESAMKFFQIAVQIVLAIPFETIKTNSLEDCSPTPK